MRDITSGMVLENGLDNNIVAFVIGLTGVKGKRKE